MRTLFATLIVLGFAGPARPQQPAPKGMTEAPPRFGVVLRPKVYPQSTPKEVLTSVIEAAEKGEFNYLLANLLDPAFVDARLADRAKQFEPVIEVELATLRDFQKQNAERILPDARVPDEPVRFRAVVADQARTRAYRQLVRDVQEKLAEDPEVMKDLRRFNRTGTFNENGDTAKVGHPDIKDRAVFLKKIGDRWFVENRQTEEKPPEPKK